MILKVFIDINNKISYQFCYSCVKSYVFCSYRRLYCGFPLSMTNIAVLANFSHSLHCRFLYCCELSKFRFSATQSVRIGINSRKISRYQILFSLVCFGPVSLPVFLFQQCTCKSKACERQSFQADRYTYLADFLCFHCFAVQMASSCF